jgi:hypothetical protein
MIRPMSLALRLETAIALERECCAMIADAVAAEMDGDGDLRLSVEGANGFREAALTIAERIRARE